MPPRDLGYLLVRLPFITDLTLLIDRFGSTRHRLVNLAVARGHRVNVITDLLTRRRRRRSHRGGQGRVQRPRGRQANRVLAFTFRLSLILRGVTSVQAGHYRVLLVYGNDGGLVLEDTALTFHRVCRGLVTLRYPMYPTLRVGVTSQSQQCNRLSLVTEGCRVLGAFLSTRSAISYLRAIYGLELMYLGVLERFRF